MTPQVQAILQSARIAELRDTTSSVARLCRPPGAVELPRHGDGNNGRRLLFLLLARERRRNARLVAELVK
jgi:hypothetical protein